MSCQNQLAHHKINPYIQRDDIKWVGSTRYTVLTANSVGFPPVFWSQIVEIVMHISPKVARLVTDKLPKPVSTS
jgi:hypothetical protein